MNYIGSKFSILSYIDEVVEDFTKLGDNRFNGFGYKMEPFLIGDLIGTYY